MRGEDWSVEGYYARVRASELKPTPVKTVFTDPEGYPWYVDDPASMTLEQRKETFAALEFKRGRGPAPFSGLG